MSTDDHVHGLQKERTKELEARVEALLNERDVLKGRVQQLKVSPILLTLQQLQPGSEDMQTPILPCRVRQFAHSMASTHH